MDRRTLIMTVMAGWASPVLGQIPADAPDLSTESGFQTWLLGFRTRALAAGLSADRLDRELAGLTPDPRIPALDNRQPEFLKPFSQYIRTTVSEDRIALGRRYRASLLPSLQAIEAAYGVPGDILLAIWGMESGFGAVMGNFDVVRAMATLAAQGRRQAFAEAQLIAALRIIDSGEFPRSRLVGSWAGAMGQTQFIPESFLSTAVDADGDGQRDIWGSSLDALASAANLMLRDGWRRGEGWAREVVVPDDFDFSLVEGPALPPAAWDLMDVRCADGLPWSDSDQASTASLIAPTGANGPLFLLLPNHFVIRKYNNAMTYALAVGLLADRFAGGAPLVRPWPDEVPLSMQDRLMVQEKLTAQGFDPGPIDGLTGVKTRAALRAWQKSKGLLADGYISPDIIAQLRDLPQP